MELRLTIVWNVVAYFPDDQSLAITHYTHCSRSLTTGHDTPARVMSGLWIFRVTLQYFVTATLGHFSPGYHHRVESIKLAKNVHGGITSDVETRGPYPPIRSQMWADLTSQRQGWKPGEDYACRQISEEWEADGWWEVPTLTRGLRARHRLTPSFGEFLHAIISDSNTDNTSPMVFSVIQLLSLLFSLELQTEGGNDIPVPEEARETRETYCHGSWGRGRRGENNQFCFPVLSPP